MQITDILPQELIDFTDQLLEEGYTILEAVKIAKEKGLLNLEVI